MKFENKFELKDEPELGQTLIIKIDPSEEIFSLVSTWDEIPGYLRFQLFLTPEEKKQLINVLIGKQKKKREAKQGRREDWQTGIEPISDEELLGN